MTLIDRIGRTMPDLWLTIARFPIPALVCLAGAVVINLDIAGIAPFEFDRAGPYRSEQIYGGLVSGFLAAGAAHLYAESRQWNGLTGMLLAFITGALLAAVCWFLRPLDLQFEFLLPGLVLSVMVAGYVSSGGNDNNAIWMFNARLALAVLLSGLVTVVFGGGLSAIVESIRYLFGVEIDSNIHGHIWATGVALIGALYGLSMVSRNLSETFHPERQSGLLVTGTLLLLNYLLVPLALIYVVILHLYAGKMLIEWELPKGQVGIMVLIFSLGGAAIWLIAFPWRGSGSALLRLFSKNWFLFLIVPLCLLAIGTWRRISDYGVTPERYGLVALGLWVAFLIVWFLVRRRTIQPRIILGSLCILLVASSFGPWGAGSVSIANQQGRLTELMREAGYFRDGKLAIPDTIDAKASGEAYSIVIFLLKNRRLDSLAPMFAGTANDPFDGGKSDPSANDVTSILGFAKRQDDGRSDDDKIAVRFHSTGPMTLEVRQAAVVSGVIELAVQQTASGEADETDPALFIDNGTFIIRYQENRWEMKVGKLLETVQAVPRADFEYPPLVVTLPGGDGDARMVVLDLTGKFENGEASISYVSAIVLLPALLSRSPDD